MSSFTSTREDQYSDEAHFHLDCKVNSENFTTLVTWEPDVAAEHWRIQGGGGNMAMAPPKAQEGGAKWAFGPPKTHDFLDFFKLFFSKVNFAQSQKIVD